MQHDDKGEDSIHAIVIANVHEMKPDKENEKSLEAGRNQVKPDEGEDEGDDEAAGESRSLRRKPKTNTKSTTETRRKNRTRVVESPLTKLRIRCNLCIF